MPPQNSLKILFVINPVSGAKKNTDWESVIREYFQHHEHTLDFFLLEGDDVENTLKNTIKKLNPRRVVAVGGDGTVSLVAKQLLGSSIEMGILPAGSANGMAKELDIPADVTQALEVIISENTRRADVILINDKEICLHLSDIGMNAQLIRYFEAKNLRGMLGYASVVLKVLIRRRRMHVIIESGNTEVMRFAVMVALANARKYGTGAIINPDGSLYDGLFEVIVVRRLAILEVLKMFFRLQRFNPKKIEVFHAKSVTIETSHKVHFQIDGEYQGKVDSVKAKILPAQISLLLPPAKE